ncbi:rotamase-domain-containing protein [Meredithblackwellia eburnea MCA 4105]
MSDWEIRFSQSKARPYFYSPSTQTSVWTKPEGLTDEQIQQLPGAHFLTSAPPQAAPPGKVRASHLLVKHKDSRRPSSWKTATITKSKEEAITELKGFQAQLKEASPADLPKKFAELAGKESDCSSARDGGDLGWFTTKQMQKPFEDATFATEVGSLSDIVETDSGVHIILRTG